ncbi:hypothetical protein LR48_Vigan05g131200 [Vigna angularis]|uniref:Uncharacterized protein n=1 Tax=Phaseolus angularis TaxID=3914 RepID=A0A0L9UMB2_PHAAN|nr:hypothetical protein LR48_Vigan05g131200 [Vigna angularis]
MNLNSAAAASLHFPTPTEGDKKERGFCCFLNATIAIIRRGGVVAVGDGEEEDDDDVDDKDKSEDNVS